MPTGRDAEPLDRLVAAVLESPKYAAVSDSPGAARRRGGAGQAAQS